ncbi:uncharacterized protein LOC108933837 [Scleropages formosus]|uniref:uncharacterized protein LOC108933837 n=1 Tax=Scleropages formosus TaxID=113540 RepID=UPI000878A626|nr:uncharacterized protein LOC108933837 [Scleropages formosus]
MKALVLLCLLSSGILPSDAQINETILARIGSTIRNRYNINGQFAYVLRVPDTQCTNGPDQNFLQGDPNIDVQNALNQQQVYQGNNIIIAQPSKMQNYAIHAEYRLLTPPQSGAEAPIDILLRQGGPNECMIFFTRISPCLDRCAGQGPYSILNRLGAIAGWGGRKVFYFVEVYSVDQSRRKDVLEALKTINRRGNVPIFRCRGNACFNCLADEARCVA